MDVVTIGFNSDQSNWWKHLVPIFQHVPSTHHQRSW